ALVAGFTQSTLSAVVGTTIFFTDTSTTNAPPIIAWVWDFGDGSAPVLTQNAAHAYTRAGTFTVTLTVSDTFGYADTTSGVVTITAPALVAGFTQSTLSAVVGTTIFFTDTSTTNAPPIIAWAWDFGDGSARAFTQNAAHAYTRAGTFTVTLTVTDTLGYQDTHAEAIQVLSGKYAIFLPLVLRNN
ncbi:MAG TPA: PKD domain-containing protein, partial [Anaerolineae bacterium]|nr:PKD domain-containing protein [Anaerolineae bacterium]